MIVCRMVSAIVLLALPALVQCNVLNLARLDWTLKNQNGSIAIPATIPSQAHLDLLNAGIITEPLLGINDFTQRWIVDDNWTYTADLSGWLKTNPRHEVKTLLVFYGIDTVGTISVAGHPVAWVDNQFRQYTYDITGLLSAPVGGDTNITVALESAWFYGMNVTSRPDVEWTYGTFTSFEYPNVRQVIRKTQSDFGWDWGPAFVPSGIFRPAYLVSLPTVSAKAVELSQPVSHPLLVSQNSHIYIEESSLEIFKTGQTMNSIPIESAPWLINVTLSIRSPISAKTTSIFLSISELGFVSALVPVQSIPATTSSATVISAIFTFSDDKPQRWYPHNLGTPKLYDIVTTLHLDNRTSVNFNTRTGFRTIALVQSPYSQAEVESRGITPGDQWHFEVNGKAFYSLGTSVIPFDPFYPRITSSQVRWLLESAVLSGQNMIRIWGGGIYQPSDELTGGYDFYSVCDELGILVWSEFIFSDSPYPINDFLLDSIEPEVRQNVRRINKHPSNVQWAGGNELETVLYLIMQTQANASHYVNEFLTLFQVFLHDIVSEETNSVAYIDSSTTNDVLSLNPYVVRLKNCPPGGIYGNGERYNYDASVAFDYSTYPVSRFMNEFGFHSQPFSWEEVLECPEDFSFNSTVVMSRDHHPPAGGLAFRNPNAPVGQAQMTQAVELWLPTPGTSDSNQTFAQWCWSTQVFQSMNMISEIAFYRRGAGESVNNLGSLVWQLNDIWQGTSWSAIEHSGRWKVLQYGMVKMHSPVIVYPFWTASTETLEVLVTSDRWDAIKGTAQLTWYDWHVISNTTGLDRILPAGYAAEDVWLLLNLTARVGGQTITNEQVFTPAPLSVAHLADPQIHVARGRDLTFRLSAKGGVAAWTWLDHPAGTVGYFVDAATEAPLNGFFLIPGIDRTVKFIQNKALSKVRSPKLADFVVRSLWNNTHV